MQPVNKLFNTIRTYNTDADLDMIKLAYDFAERAHSGQKRRSGENYIEHSLATAQTLAEMKLNPTIIIAALLHDVPEDTDYTLDDIRENFGEEVASLVEGITKLGKIKYRGLERYIENLRKMFIAMAKDLRVILIKFADRLHNLKTLESLPPSKQLRIARESLEIYAPIANRLGIGELKGNLEDYAFKYVYPKEYEWTTRLLKNKFPKKEKYIRKIKKIVRKEIEKESIKSVSVHGRTKRLYSLYKKLLKYEGDINKIYDLIALRIIVPTISDCYAVLGIIHNKWKPLKGRIKDYIAQPKPNGYQSLHTTVFCDEGEIVEFQIRTPKMHEEAEYGIAAHWHYTEEKASEKVKRDLKWVKELTKWQKEIQENQKYLENLKIDVFQNRIFALTPKGEVIDLPEGSTPIDFAYHVHTDIGNKCAGVRINDKIASIDTKINSGDVVEIITDKNRKYPSADWLKFVKTNMAKQKIRWEIKQKDKNSLKKMANIK